MSDQDACPNGRPDCNFAEAHEFALVEQILLTIEGYIRAGQIDPCPKCLRNSMMIIAALLHLEGLKDDGRQHVHEEGIAFAEAFAESARERMHIVMEAALDWESLLADKRRLM